MFQPDDEKYLLRMLGNNQVVLFLGAGFSRNVQNRLGESFPTAHGLGQKLWDFLGYSGAYDNTSLPEMYDAFLNVGRKRSEKESFLADNLLAGNIPKEYYVIAKAYWYKIYTTNIDDILTHIYAHNNKGLQELIYPQHEYSERDQSLHKTQAIYLHGKLPCDPKNLIFSTQQYAKAQLANQPLYGQFVYDYASLPTIFIGTELNEPLFSRYIESREGKLGYRELRPKSFLITPSLSPVKADNLKNNHNVILVKGTTQDFLLWLERVSPSLPTAMEIIQKTFPNLLSLTSYSNISGISINALNDFAKSFIRVPKEIIPHKERSAFLLGASPRWNDIVSDLDIPRTITTDIYDAIEESFTNPVDINKLQIITLTGYAGSGKSTILKRLGLRLSQNGRTVFLTYSEIIPKAKEVIEVLDAIDEKVVLIFDNANAVLGNITVLCQELTRHIEKLPVILISVRSNYKDKLNYYLDPDVYHIQAFQIPNLDDVEIDALILKLEQNNLLGILKGMPSAKRKKEFVNRAHRQILIAMKEATNGMPFEQIIASEFSALEPEEVKSLAICIALNTELGYTNSKQDIVGFSKSAPIEALNYLETVLDGTIMWVGTRDRFMLRHKVLADYFIKNCNPQMLKDAYVRVLSILAPELKRSAGPSKKLALFRALTNHQVLYSRFKNSIDMARDVYDSLAEYFDLDGHFWLQYGSLELEGFGGNLNLAENYLNQAESLLPADTYIKNAQCNLFYKRAIKASSFEQAILFKERADSMAHLLLLQVGKVEPHIHHVYCSGRYKYITTWIKDPAQKKSELSELRKTILSALRYHPRDKKLEIAAQAIDRAYLQLGSKDELIDPEIPDFK